MSIIRTAYGEGGGEPKENFLNQGWNINKDPTSTLEGALKYKFC